MSTEHDWTGLDKEMYLKSIAKFLTSDHEFNNFKQDRDYQAILEHLGDRDGAAIYNMIGKKSLVAICAAVNDVVGNPTLRNDIQVSNSTIRYCWFFEKILLKIANIYNVKSICEIGAGYGGLISILGTYLIHAKVLSVVDLELPSKLQEKYMSMIGLSVLRQDFPENIIDQSYDLVVATYSLSELSKNAQDAYLDKVLSKSKNGFLAYNPHCYTVQEFVEKLRAYGIQANVEEDCMTGLGWPEHRIIYWNE